MAAMQHPNIQPLTIVYVGEIFKNLESGDGKGFFD
jgi:hypothetical protein